MTVHVGVSGWSYPRWRGDFYPRGLRHADELAYLTERLSAVEVNASFYRLQRPSTYAAWAAQAPACFRFAVKGSRYITHLRRLHDIRVPLANFLASGPGALEARLGPLLWQLPANLAYDQDTVETFLALLPRTAGHAASLAAEHDVRVTEPDRWERLAAGTQLRHAVEPRHPSFGSAAALEALARHGIALVIADSAGEFPAFDHVTTDFAYVRLHGSEMLYAGGYDATALAGWAERVEDLHARTGEVWVFFDNDADGRAPYDAVALGGLLTNLLP